MHHPARGAVGALLMLVIATSASAAHAAPRVTLAGGSAQRAVLCGAERAVTAVGDGGMLSAVLPAARDARDRSARRGSAVIVERCAAGRWQHDRAARLGERTRVLRLADAVTPHDSADLRIRVRTRTGGYGPPAYARVGAGEIVDVPVSFKVVNQNRTLIPCLPGPDGTTATVHGTLVAPRSVLDSPSPAITLYLHGLGYSSFFFRFQDVPGYDYGRQQAEAGHAGVYVDRLGNPAHDDLADGNSTCLPAQADMADQIVRALRAGKYESEAKAPFERVILAGHSAGGFIAEIAQYSFASADALALIGYTDIPSPLALGTFLVSGGDCLTAPQHAHGQTGAPNYAAFGRTDADFAAGHFHDIDPAVAAAVLARRNLDPCGDLLNAAQALVADQVLAKSIKVPVLVISGADDALFSPPTNKLQAATSYPASTDVSLTELPDTGHAVTLGRTHDAFRRGMATWLSAHGG